MAGAADEEEMESLLRNFDQIYQVQREAVVEIQKLRSSLDAEVRSCQALQFACDDLRTDNERLRKLNAESLAKLANRLERHTKFQSLKEELKEVNNQLLIVKDEHAKANEIIKQEHQSKIEELQRQVSCYVLEESVHGATIDALKKDLASRDSQIDNLHSSLQQVAADVESRHHRDIQDLREWLMVEQEEKNMLHKRLQNAENEILALKAKQTERQQESISSRHVETLKQKIMKLRQENENLKRQLAATCSQVT